MSLFLNKAKGSASELLADLAACRQFRHLTDADRRHALAEAYLHLAECWMGYKAIKHPDPNNPCAECGGPRSKFSGSSGLCYRCYAASGIEERDLWVEDVFVHAITSFGFVCDACAETVEPQAGETRAAVIRMLDNMDGCVKPVLCAQCSSDFKSYASRHFGRGSWRIAPARDIEKIVICWFAQKVKVLAERKKRAA